MRTLRILGLLMSYPKPEWLLHLDECRASLNEEGILQGKPLKNVLTLIEKLAAGDMYRLQEEYVETFDRGRSHCLHLFEHIHGESRDRGQAMVNLATAYEAKGFYIDRAELPDYIPLFLEFLSLCPADEAVELLGEPVDILAAIAARLGKRDSAYAALFDALVALSRTKPHEGRLKRAIAEMPDDSLQAMDREWEEAAAFGGAPSASACRTCAAPPRGLDVKIN